ncbi:hypothetical protein ISX56_11890, partial [Serratia ureilytica]|nr:hypothetical protein [Serratia ureilytica]
MTLDGFSFEAITRRIADIYRALRHGLSPAPRRLPRSA